MFNELSQEQLSSLYKLAPIKKLEEDQILIKEGDKNQTFYLILDGEIRIVKDFQGRDSVLGSVGRGSLLGEISFTRRIPRTASAVANKPSTVMVIEEATFSALDKKMQFVFLRQMNELSCKRIQELEAREIQLSSQNQQLMTHLFNTRAQSQPDYDSSETIQAIINKIPRLPFFAIDLSVKLFEERTTVKEISEIIKQDPSLLGLVMKRINSAYYGFRNKISDIDRAIVLIGFNGLYQLAVSEGARRTMPDRQYFRDLHAHMMAISNISYFLSLITHRGTPAEIATIGLLHDLGNTVVELLRDQNPNLRFLLDSLDPSQMGSILLKKWGLPEAVWKSIGYQSYPEFCSPSKIPQEILANVALIFMAHLCYQIFQTHSEQNLPVTFVKDYKAALNLENFSLLQIVEKILLPALAKRLKTFPAPFRNLIVNYIEVCDSSKIKRETKTI